MFGVEFNSDGYKTLVAPPGLFRGLVGVCFVVVLWGSCLCFSSKLSVAWMYCRGGRRARDGARLIALNVKRRIHIQGLSQPVLSAASPRQGISPKPGG